MALYRHVRTEFWKDPKVQEEMTPEDKLFFLYLMTNTSTTQIGIYKITKKQIAFEMGYSIERVNSLMDRFENYHKLIRYNKDTREVAIKNWAKYNLNKGGKPIIDCVRKELGDVKDKELLNYISKGIIKQEIKIMFDEAYNKLSNCNEEEKLKSTPNSECTSEQYDSYNDTSTIGGQKEKQKEKEKEKQNKTSRYVLFYEKNVGTVNELVYDWLVEISNLIEFDLYKKSIQIATDRNNCTKAYIGGILNKWVEKNIYSIADLNNYMETYKFKGEENNDKSRYIRELENEDSSIYQKPTKEQLSEIRKFLGDK